MAATVGTLIVLSTAVLCANSDLAARNEEYLRFPPNFLVGAATAAYQVEGAWNASDKGESVWDRFAHDSNGRVYNDETGDVACDSYRKFREDVALLKEIGFNAYRFSVSWPRVLPTGFANKVSEDGIAYYKRLVDELLANNIEPVVTLYHWDHPQVIEDAGGWTNAKIVDWFGDYARIVFRELGPKVKLFITLNEATDNCVQSYVKGKHAPGKLGLHGIGEYLCGENVLKAHARAYHIYQEEFKKSQNGSVGVNVHLVHTYPKNSDDASSPEIAFQFDAGWMLHPIYSEKGDYPDLMKELIARRSREQGYPWSRLPNLSPEWVEYIRGSSDFLSVNHYTTNLVQPGRASLKPSFFDDEGLIRTQDPAWKSSASSWLKVVPKGFGDALRKLSAEYNNPAIYVMENGFSDLDGANDTDRVSYYREYTKEMLLAINRDGVDVRGYILWSLLDNFEWERGYRERFGVVHVDFADPGRKRTLKSSAYWWQRVIRDHGLRSTGVNATGESRG